MLVFMMPVSDSGVGLLSCWHRNGLGIGGRNGLAIGIPAPANPAELQLL